MYATAILFRLLCETFVIWLEKSEIASNQSQIFGTF